MIPLDTSPNFRAFVELSGRKTHFFFSTEVIGMLRYKSRTVVSHLAP